MIGSVLRIDAKSCQHSLCDIWRNAGTNVNDTALLTMSGSVRSSFDSPRRQSVLNSAVGSLT